MLFSYIVGLGHVPVKIQNLSFFNTLFTCVAFYGLKTKGSENAELTLLKSIKNISDNTK